MAVVTLSVPDEVREKYTRMQPQNPNRAMTNQLERFQEFPSTERALILTAAERKELEALHKLPFETGADLVKWVKQMMTVSVEGTDLTLSEMQIKRLKAQSEFYKKDFTTYLADNVRRGLSSQIGS